MFITREKFRLLCISDDLRDYDAYNLIHNGTQLKPLDRASTNEASI